MTNVTPSQMLSFAPNKGSLIVGDNASRVSSYIGNNGAGLPRIYTSETHHSNHHHVSAMDKLKNVFASCIYDRDRK